MFELSLRLAAGATLYRKLGNYLMTEEQLQENGYPRANPDAAGKAIIFNLPEKKAIADREWRHSAINIMVQKLFDFSADSL